VSSALVRIIAIGGPIALGFVTAMLVAHAFGPVRGVWARIGVWVVATVAAALVIDGSMRLGRRLTPLSTLLAVSLAFPDRAPSRLGVALRAGAPRRLLLFDADHRHRPETDAARVLALAAGLTAHDRATRGHSERVRAYSELIADELGLDDTAHDRLRWAALLHDVGKVTVPARTLNATHPLSEEERELLRRHPEEGHALTAPLAPFLGEWENAVAQHHERYDGGGYPNGLRGEELSLAARIVSVADSFDAMTSERSYAKPLSMTTARSQLVEKAGGQFDPEVVRAFLNVGIGRLRRIAGWGALVAAVPSLLPLSRVARRVPASVATSSAALIAAVSLATVGPASVAPSLAHAPSRPAVVPVAPSTAPQNASVAVDAATAPVSVLGTRFGRPRTSPSSTPTAPAPSPPASNPPKPSPPPPTAPPPPRLPCQLDIGVACAGVTLTMAPLSALVHAEVRPTATAITVGPLP
jgi:putative nucleotidyltransferase with HDIG domain